LEFNPCATHLYNRLNKKPRTSTLSFKKSARFIKGLFFFKFSVPPKSSSFIRCLPLKQGMFSPRSNFLEGNEIPNTKCSFLFPVKIVFGDGFFDGIGHQGVETCVSKLVTVSHKLAKISVDIFYGAEDLVRHLFGLEDDPTGADMTNVFLSDSLIRPSLSPQPGSPYRTQITLVNSGTSVTMMWDGTGDTGAFVTPDHCQMEVHWDDGQGRGSGRQWRSGPAPVVEIAGGTLKRT
jgi:hypothetical protein